MRYLRQRKTDAIGPTIVSTAVDHDRAGMKATFRTAHWSGDSGSPQEWMAAMTGLAMDGALVVVVRDACATDVPSALALLDLPVLVPVDWKLHGSPTISANVTKVRLQKTTMYRDKKTGDLKERTHKLDIVSSSSVLPGVDLDGPGRLAVQRMDKLIAERCEIIGQHQLGGFGITAAAQAHRALGRRAQPRTLVVRGSGHEAPREERRTMLEQLGYSGGRIHRRIGTHTRGPYRYCDFTAAYANLLASGRPYPIQRGHPVALTPEALREELAAGYGVIAMVRAEVHTPLFPYRTWVQHYTDSGFALPRLWADDGLPNTRSKALAGVRYPTGGPFWLALTTRELDRERRGDLTIHEVGHAWTYELDSQPWVDFGKDALGLRADLVGSPHAVWAKCVAAFLHGKLAQTYAETIELEDQHEPPPHAERYRSNGVDYVKMFNLWFGRGPWRWSADTMTGTAAHVTADCRLLLGDALQIAGDDVVFAHTDGLLVGPAGYERLCERFADAPWRVDSKHSMVQVLDVGWWAPTERRVSGLPTRSVRVSQSTWEWTDWTAFSGLPTGGVVYGSPNSFTLS